MVLATRKKFIKYLSYAYHGTSHDLSMLRSELPADEGAWFSDHVVHVDLAYQGLGNDYTCKQLSIPFKKPRGGELTQEQKNANKERSAIRVVVENAIAGLKRYRFLSDRLRCRKIVRYNKIIGVCAGLWNISLTH